MRAPGGEKDGEEFALLPCGRRSRSGQGLPIGLMSQTTRKPATKTATAIRRGPCQLAGGWAVGGDIGP